MTSRVRISARSRPSLPIYPHFNRLRAFDLVSSPVWWEAVTNIILTLINTSLAFACPDGVSIHCRVEAKRSLASVEPPLGGRVAF